MKLNPVSPDVQNAVAEAVKHAVTYGNGNLDPKMMNALSTWLQPSLARVPRSVGFINGDAIGEALMPSVAASPDTGIGAIYPIFKKEAFMIVNDVVAPGGNVHTSDIVMDWGDCTLKVHSQQTFVEPRELKVAQASGVDLVARKLDMLKGRLALSKEKEIADTVQATASYGSNYLTLDGTAGKYRWNDKTNGDPIAAIAAADEDMRRRIGQRGNTLVLSPKALYALKYHPKLTALGQYVATKQSPNIPASLELLAAVTGKNIVVGEMLTSSDGDAAALTDLWDNTAALLYVGAADLYSPQFGMTLTSSGFPSSESFRDMQRGYSGTQFYRLSDAWGAKVVVPDAGFLWTSVTA